MSTRKELENELEEIELLIEDLAEECDSTLEALYVYESALEDIAIIEFELKLLESRCANEEKAQWNKIVICSVSRCCWFITVLFWSRYSEICLSKCNNSENEELIEELTQKNQQLEVQLQEIQKSLIEAQETASEPQSDNDGERIELLKDFGHKWVNYDSVYERNQSIKDYLTEKAIEENAIDVDPHSDFEGVGEIDSIRVYYVRQIV